MIPATKRPLSIATARATSWSPRAKTLLNIGAILGELDRAAEAANALAKYASDPNADRDKLPAVRKLLDSLDRAVGRLELYVKRPGKVSIDGTEIGTGPLSQTLRLELGSHTVSVDATERTMESKPGLAVQMVFEPTQTTGAGGSNSGQNGQAGGLGSSPAKNSDGSSVFAHPALWTGVVALVAAGAGTAFGFSVRAAENDLDDLNQKAAIEGSMIPWTQARDLQDKAEKRALYSNVAFGVAGVAAITTVVLYLVIDTSDPDEPATKESATVKGLTPTVGKDSVGVSFIGRF